MNAALKRVEHGLRVTPDLIEAIATYVVDGYRSLLGTQYAGRGDDPDYLFERLGADFDAGVLPGVEQPMLSADGRRTEMKRRRYVIAEIEALLALPSVVEAIEALRALRAEEAQADKREKNVAQLAAARRRQAQQAEFRSCPLLYAQVVAYGKALAILKDQMDRQMGSNVTHIELPPPLNEFE